MPRTRPTRPADYIGLGGYTLGKLGAGACALVVFDPPRAPKNPADAAAEFVEGMRLRDYKFNSYKTKKKDEEDVFRSRSSRRGRRSRRRQARSQGP